MQVTKDNYKLLAAKLYRNPILVDQEFAQDMVLITKVVNRLKKFFDTGELKVKMLYNNYVTACNCFGDEYVHKVMLLTCSPRYRDLICTWIFTLSGERHDIIVNDGLHIKSTDIVIIKTLVEKIRNELR